MTWENSPGTTTFYCDSECIRSFRFYQMLPWSDFKETSCFVQHSFIGCSALYPLNSITLDFCHWVKEVSYICKYKDINISGAWFCFGGNFNLRGLFLITLNEFMESNTSSAIGDEINQIICLSIFFFCVFFWEFGCSKCGFVIFGLVKSLSHVRRL